MNSKQKIFLWIGIVVIVLMGLFPPWFFTTSSRNGGLGLRRVDHSESFYKFITPRPYKGLILADIDLNLLCVQWVIVAAITTGLVVTLKDKKPKDEQKE